MLYKKPGLILNAQDASASFTSDPVRIEGGRAHGIELSSSGGTHVGYIEVQLSVTGDVWSSVQWNDDDLVNRKRIPLASGTALAYVAQMDTNNVGGGVRYLRLKYTATSGTGTITATVA